MPQLLLQRCGGQPAKKSTAKGASAVQYARTGKKKKAAGGLFSVLIRLLVIALCGYLVVSLVTNEMDIMIKNQQIASLKQQVLQQQAETLELQRLLESGSDIGEYFEKIAREKLGYSYPDEQIFVDINGQ